MIQYRSFRNTDPPSLADAWNDALTGRAAVRLRHSSPLESFAFSKPYFDPKGLILAEDDGRCVGFAHAGFGANAERTALDRGSGVICVVAVRPSHRGRGIGGELVRRAETYLSEQGARSIVAGPLDPCNPFYLGLYGGSELPGFLASDLATEPFLNRLGYTAERTVRVVQRRMSVPVKAFDARAVGHRQRFELIEDALSPLGSWWRYCQFNGGEPRVMSLVDRTTGEPVARATVWEMEGFSERWGLPAVGVLDWEVLPSLRGQGIGKHLLVQLMRRAQDDLFELMELHIPTENQAAWKVCQAVGFTQVDVGRSYRRADAGPA